MNTLPNNGLSSDIERRDTYGSGEDTLRLISRLPVPEELPERIKARLSAAPAMGSILPWRGPLRPVGGWMRSSVVRGAAAAAIVCVVAGGGWRIYSHVPPAPAAKVIQMPSPAAHIGSGFSNAGARRVPQTLEGPVLTHPVPPASDVNVVDKVLPQPKAASGGALSKKKRKAEQTTAVPAGGN